MENARIAPSKNILNPSGFFGSALIGMISGGAAGLVAGILARAAMRVVAIVGGMTPGFSIEGTMAILMIGVLLGIGPGILYAISLPVWQGTPGRKGWTIGLVLAALFAGIFLSIDPDGELALAPTWLVIAMFGSITLVYGVLLGMIAGRLAPSPMAAGEESGGFLRTAGLLTLIGGLVSGLIELFMAAMFPAASAVGVSPVRFLEGLAGAGTILAIIAGLAGLLRSRAAGENRLVKAVLGITLAEVTILGMGSVFQGAGMMELHGLVRLISRLEYNPDLFILLVLLGIGIVFMLVAGVAVMSARQWTGWRRFMPLAVALIPVLSVPLLHPDLLPDLLGVSVFGRNQLGHWVGAVYGLAWLAMGIAMRAESGLAETVSSADDGT